MVGVGVAVGPITGGWLLEHFAWGAIFWVNVPVAAAGHRGRMALRADLARPGHPTGGRGRADSVLDRSNRRWSTPSLKPPTGDGAVAHTVIGFAVAAIVLFVFAVWEHRRTHPMLDVSVFANRRFSGGSLAVTAGFLTLFGFIFVITQYFQFIKSYSAFETGVRLLPVAVSIALGSAFGPRIVERIGTTVVVSGGLAMFAAGLAWASTADAATPYLVIAMQMVLLGGGLGLTTAPATEAIMGSLSADKAGVGSAVNDTTRELGGTLGVAIVGSVFASVYSGRLAGDSVIATLPAEVGATMERSMAAAQKVIGGLPSGRAADVRDAVNTAFLDGLQVGTLVCAAIALGAAVVVAVLLPARAKPPADAAAPTREPATKDCVTS